MAKHTVLEWFKENARQLDEAKIAAKNAHKAILEYIDFNNAKTTWYWNGAAYDRKPLKTYGTMVVQFKKPQGWEK